MPGVKILVLIPFLPLSVTPLQASNNINFKGISYLFRVTQKEDESRYYINLDSCDVLLLRRAEI